MFREIYERQKQMKKIINETIDKCNEKQNCASQHICVVIGCPRTFFGLYPQIKKKKKILILCINLDICPSENFFPSTYLVYCMPWDLPRKCPKKFKGTEN